MKNIRKYLLTFRKVCDRVLLTVMVIDESNESSKIMRTIECREISYKIYRSAQTYWTVFILLNKEDTTEAIARIRAFAPYQSVHSGDDNDPGDRLDFITFSLDRDVNLSNFEVGCGLILG